MNRRQLLTLGGLTVAAPAAMAAPAAPAGTTVGTPTEIRIAVLDPGDYTVKIVGSEVYEDRIVMRLQVQAPMEYITFHYTQPAAPKEN